MNARMPGQPLLDLRMFVRGIVVADQVKRLGSWRFAINLAQEGEPLAMPMTLLAARDDRTIESADRRKQRGGAVALVVMGHGRSTARLHRQAGLGSVERLHLALLVATQHQRVLRRRHIETDRDRQYLRVSRQIAGRAKP